GRSRRARRRRGGGRTRFPLPRPPQPPRAPLRPRGSGTRRQRCSRQHGARGRRRRTPAGHAPASERQRARASSRARPRSLRPPCGRAAPAGTHGSAHSRTPESAAARTRARAYGGEGRILRHMEAQASAVSAPLARIPNALTIARLALIPVFVVLMVRAGHDPSWPAGIVFAIAAITDHIDGFLARRWHVESQFGKIADPLADRLMIDAAVILLVAYDRLPWVGLLIIVGRDV